MSTNPVVPLLDLKPQYQAIKQEIDEAVARVIASQIFILGPEVEAFEKEIAECNISETEIVILPGGFSADTSVTITTFKDNKAIRTISWRNNPASQIPFEGLANIEFKSDGTLNYTERSNFTSYWNESTTSGFWSWQKTAKRKYTIDISDFQNKGLGVIFVGGIFKIKQLSSNQITLESSNDDFISYPDSRESKQFSTTTFCQLENQLRQRQLQLKQEQLRHLQDLNHDKKNSPLKISLYPLQ